MEDGKSVVTGELSGESWLIKDYIKFPLAGNRNKKCARDGTHGSCDMCEYLLIQKNDIKQHVNEFH